MKKPILKYASLLVVGVAVSFGIYIVSSWLILQYKLLREDSLNRDISIVAQNVSNDDISRSLMNEWLSEYKKNIYVENKIEDYIIHSIKLEEEQDGYFIFSSHYSIMTDNEDTAWKNWPHTQQGNQFIFDRRFRVNKVDDTYYFRTVTEATDVDFAK
ncbi:MAG TPA: hypothetical protein VGD58_06230 [Herpetosiphonaceae bacterium]